MGLKRKPPYVGSYRVCQSAPRIKAANARKRSCASPTSFASGR